MLFRSQLPGSAVENFNVTENEVTFKVYADEDVQFTLELEPESCFEVIINGESTGKMSTNLSGKLSVSVEIDEDKLANIKVVKC